MGDRPVYSQDNVRLQQGNISDTLRLYTEENIFHHKELLGVIRPEIAASVPGIMLELFAANKAVKDALYKANSSGGELTSDDLKMDQIVTEFVNPVPLQDYDGAIKTPSMQFAGTMETVDGNVIVYHQCLHVPEGEENLKDAFNPKTDIEQSTTFTRLRLGELDDRQLELNLNLPFFDMTVPENLDGYFEALESLCNSGSYSVNGKVITPEYFHVSRSNNIPFLLAASCAGIIGEYSVSPQKVAQNVSDPENAKEYVNFFSKLNAKFNPRTIKQVYEDWKDEARKELLEALIEKYKIDMNSSIPTASLPLYKKHGLKFYRLAGEIKPGDNCRVWLSDPKIVGRTYEITFYGTLDKGGEEWWHLFDFTMQFKENNLGRLAKLLAKKRAKNKIAGQVDASK